MSDDVLAPKKRKLPMPTKIALAIGAVAALGFISYAISMFSSEPEQTQTSTTGVLANKLAEPVAGGAKTEEFASLERDYNQRRIDAAKSQGQSAIDTLPSLELIKPATERVVTEAPRQEPIVRYDPKAEADKAAQRAYVEKQLAEKSELEEERRQAKLAAMQGLMQEWAIPSHDHRDVIGYVSDEASTDTPGADGDDAAKNKGNPVPVGTLMYASLDTPINSDEPSPIRATILSGKLKGAVLVGGYDRVGEKVLMSFDMISFEGNSVGINAIAIDPKTNRTSIASSVDTHAFSRWASLIGASFLEGISDAVSSNNTTVQVNDSSATTSSDFSSGEQAAIAIGKVGEKLQPIAENYFNRPPTVYVDDKKHPAVGIMFMGELRAEWVPAGIK